MRTKSDVSRGMLPALIRDILKKKFLKIFFRIGSYALKTLSKLLHVDAVNYPVVNNNMEWHYSSGGKTAVFYMGLFNDAAGMNSDGNSNGCNNGLDHNKVCGDFVVHMV